LDWGLLDFLDGLLDFLDGLLDFLDFLDGLLDFLDGLLDGVLDFLDGVLDGVLDWCWFVVRLPHLQVVAQIIDATALHFIAENSVGVVVVVVERVHRSVRFVVRCLVKESAM
jgi:hypothetical protein